MTKFMLIVGGADVDKRGEPRDASPHRHHS